MVKQLESVDWAELEKQLDGGRNHNNGNNNDDGEGGHYWGDDNDSDDKDDGWGKAYGFIGGMVPGVLVGGELSIQYEGHAINSYINKHHIATTPANRTSVEDGIFDKAVNPYADLGIIFSSAFAIMALGAAIGNKIEKMTR